jgi:hypothetical protein
VIWNLSAEERAAGTNNTGQLTTVLLPILPLLPRMSCSHSRSWLNVSQNAYGAFIAGKPAQTAAQTGRSAFLSARPDSSRPLLH